MAAFTIELADDVCSLDPTPTNLTESEDRAAPTSLTSRSSATLEEVGGQDTIPEALPILKMSSPDIPDQSLIDDIHKLLNFSASASGNSVEENFVLEVEAIPDPLTIWNSEIQIMATRATFPPPSVTEEEIEAANGPEAAKEPEAGKESKASKIVEAAEEPEAAKEPETLKIVEAAEELQKQGNIIGKRSGSTMSRLNYRLSVATRRTASTRSTSTYRTALSSVGTFRTAIDSEDKSVSGTRSSRFVDLFCTY
jgi:hypothetical protein